MAAPKFLQAIAGVVTSVTAAVLGGAGSANQLVATNASGLIDPSFLPAGQGADIVTAPASEALSAGALVNLWSNAGALAARNADSSSASGGKKISGFVLAAVAQGGTASVYRSGPNTAVTGLTPGSDYWLGAAGAAASSPDTASGHTTQYAGTATAAGVLDVQPGAPIGNA
ncbi:hypothetical protein MKK75_27085 [Methylobacterium sp. J-030]|uniref:hypothetical protein n=1 Tax=Methylobacterium sp. J-030 TaxID=2836627 RepID=UPI001FBA59CF|nr:hypothetical protein [Methylobacterium sp. J-030]MCJ2072413.1 hypothetical protein [Methylobacterium sp. J-030]